jgi:hypothetical protein
MRRLIIALAASAGLLSGCTGLEVYSPSSGKTRTQWASEHFARAGQQFAQAGRGLVQVAANAAQLAGQAAAAYGEGYAAVSASTYAAPRHYEPDWPTMHSATLIGPNGTTFINGTTRSGTIIGPDGTSFYNLSPNGSGMILGPNGTTFINGY